MKITLVSETSITLEDDGGPMSVIAESEEQQYSPFHMLGSSLALCTFSVLHSWAEQAKLDATSLAIAVAWEFAESPHRVGKMDVRITWPGLPPARLNAAQRAAALCAVHATLTHSPAVAIEVAP